MYKMYVYVLRFYFLSHICLILVFLNHSVLFLNIFDKMGYNLKKEAKGDLMSWNKRIRDLREDHDMKKYELAEKLDISERTLTRYESGECEPTVIVLIKLALLFDVSIDYIVGINDNPIVSTPSVKDELEDIQSKLDKIIKII